MAKTNWRDVSSATNGTTTLLPGVTYTDGYAFLLVTVNTIFTTMEEDGSDVIGAAGQNKSGQTIAAGTQIAPQGDEFTKIAFSEGMIEAVRSAE